MQTFLPCVTFRDSVEVLDQKRLGKQMIETGQVVRAIHDPTYGWQHHPAVKMWRGYSDALIHYQRATSEEWYRRRQKYHGGATNLWAWLDERMGPGYLAQILNKDPVLPWWWGGEIHGTHRSNLLRKDPAFYGQFGWTEQTDLPYLWPVQ
jgi:hypothetical protein